MQTVRTYMNVPKALDPAHILSMSDLELSIALASTLVVFNDERELSAGLAEKWAITGQKEITFSLRKNILWSDGSLVKAGEYRDALLRAQKLYGGDLKALFDVIERIDSKDDRTLVFVTKGNAEKSGVILKLTEPMYGLVALKGGALDLSKSVGPFFLEHRSGDELSLDVNKNWYAYAKAMPERVEIRPLKQDGGNWLANFEADSWANLTSGTSLLEANVAEQLQKNGYKTWQRTLDKVYSLYPSKRFIHAGGIGFIKHLAVALDREQLMKNLSGFTIAEQFFPRGYVLYSSKAPVVNQAGSREGKKEIVALMVESPHSPIMNHRIKAALDGFDGVKVRAEEIPVSKLNERMKKGDFDILVSSIAVADPNFEGAMSFFIERDPPVIQSGKSPYDFSHQMRLARGLPSSEERAQRMREIIVTAQEAGYVLPLFHLSSLAVAKPGIDLSGVPNSDETVLFSKVRMQ